MEYIKTITLDLALMGCLVRVPAKQGDAFTRFLKIQLQLAGADYVIPADVEAVFRAEKPDGTAAVNDAVISEDRKSVTVELTDNVLAAAGPAFCDLMLTQSGEILSTACFGLDIQRMPDVTNQMERSSEFLWLISKFQQVAADAQAAEEAKEGAVAAQEAAEEAAGHYPYIGENGHWWVWDVETGAFVDTGVHASGGTTDHTQLTNRDAANQHPMSAITGLETALSGKQATISDLDTIRSGAAAGATAVQPTAISDMATQTWVSQQGYDTEDSVDAKVAAVQSDVDGIAAVIPAQATSQNQLADKEFVNSSVQTATANFRGNWDNWAAVPTDARSYPQDYAGTRTPTTNDYMVVVDASDVPYTDPQTQAVTYPYAGTWRFKYGGVWATDGKNGWHAEYQVNETPLTAAQLAALNSGVTSGKVSGYDAHVSNDNIHVTTAEKSTWNAKGTYSKPTTGIPATDMTAAVQTSLGKADTAVQPADLATKQDTLISSGAKVGQIAKILAVDANGMPTQWGAADIEEWVTEMDTTLEKDVNSLEVKFGGRAYKKIAVLIECSAPINFYMRQAFANNANNVYAGAMASFYPDSSKSNAKYISIIAEVVPFLGVIGAMTALNESANLIGSVNEIHLDRLDNGKFIDYFRSMNNYAITYPAGTKIVIKGVLA